MSGDDDAGPAAAAAPPPTAPGWYYADPVRGPVGPYEERQFAALARAGAMPLATPVWRPGLEWAPLEARADVLGIPPSTLRQLAKAAAGEGGGGDAQQQQPDASAAPADRAAQPPQPGGGEPSPPPEERRFVEDGTTFEWDSGLRRFVEVDDDGGGPAPPPRGRKQHRSAAEVLERRAGGGKGTKPAPGADAPTTAAPPPPPPRPPTAVYVTGLPADTDEAEVAAVFSKCGLVRPARSDPTGRTPAVRLYRDPATDALKGDGTVTFLKPPSVDLALTLLDGVPLRSGEGQPAMSVSVAKFQAKDDGGARPPPPPSEAEPPAKRARGGVGGGGGGRGRGRGGRGGGAPAQQPLNPAAARAAAALGWDGFDDEAPPTDTTVVLVGGYDVGAALAGDGGVAAAEAGVAALCARALAGSAAASAGVPGGAAVDEVRLWLGEPGGLATVRFRTPAAAAVAVSRLAGRPGPVGGAELGAELWDGVAAFKARPPKAKKKKQQAVDGGDGGAHASTAEDNENDDEEARLAAFGAELFGEDDDE